jgi:3-oxoadipyl-CoA thiolase
MREAVIVDAVRTPVGRYGGALKDVRADDLAAHCIAALVARRHLDPALVEDVIFGCANQAGEDNRNVARMALLVAGLPIAVAGQTVNRLCASGLSAVTAAAHAIRVGEGDVFIAGGTESMTRAPFVFAKSDAPFGRQVKVYDTTLGWRFPNPKLTARYPPLGMGETAENVAATCHVTREEQDEFALGSQRKWAAAHAAGRFADEIVPVGILRRSGDPLVVDRDEHPRPDATLDQLAKLSPAFSEHGTVTAGNSSGINDGAAALLLMEQETARRLGYTPLARVVTSAVVGVDPSYMGLGPIPATRKALDRAGLAIDDIDLVELNEAFAAQALPCIRELGIDPAKVNVNGGAIAIGHPLGSTGARLMTTLVHEMKRRGARRGLVTMCVGVGQGIATIVERT